MSKHSAKKTKVIVRTDRASGDIVVSRRGQSAFSVAVHGSGSKARSKIDTESKRER